MGSHSSQVGKYQFFPVAKLFEGEATTLEDLAVGDHINRRNATSRLQGVFASGPRKGRKATVLGKYTVAKVNKNTIILESITGDKIRVQKQTADFFGQITKPTVRKLTDPQKAERKRLTDAGTDRAGANDIVELHANFNPIKAAADLIPQEAKDFLKQAKNRVKSKPAKELMRILEFEVDPTQNRLAGTKFEALRETGFNDRKNRQQVSSGQLANELEGRDPVTRKLVVPKEGDLMARKVNRILREMWVEARASGVKVAGFVENYFPRMWKREVAEIVFDDMLAAERKHALLRDLSADVTQVSKLVEKLASKGTLAEETRAAILHLIETNQVKTWAEGWQKIKTQAQADLFEPYGNIERRRSLEWPAEFYERDAGKVLGQYVNSWAKRVAEVKAFGPKGEKAVELLDKIRAIDPAEEAIARRIVDTFTGKLEKEERLSRGMDKFVRRFTGFEVVTKIGFGFAALKNVFQTMISTAQEAGWARTLTGIAKLVAPTEKGAARRKLVRESGALNKLAWEALTGFRPVSKSGKVSEAVLKGSGFHGANVANQYIAASTAAEFIPQLLRIAEGQGGFNRIPWVKGKRIKWAQEKLADYGIDYRKPLSAEKLKEGMFRFATDSQLQKNILRDPLAANHPKWRPFFLFKRFGLRQFNYIKDLHRKEIKRGNILPTLRLLVGGGMAGALEIEIEKLIRKLATGEEPAKEDLPLIDYAIDALGSVGAMSVVSDIVASENKLPAAGFFITPIQVQEATNAADALVQFWNDMDADAVLAIPPKEPIPTRPVPEILQRQIKPLSRFFGTIPREILKRLETSDQRKGRVANMKGRVRNEIFKELWRDDREEANRLRKDWNRRFRDNRILHSDIAAEEFYRWKVRRGKSKKPGPDVTKGFTPEIAQPVEIAPAGR